MTSEGWEPRGRSVTLTIHDGPRSRKRAGPRRIHETPLRRGRARRYGLRRLNMRGNGDVSRTWGRPQSQATVRSSPRPKPAWGKVP